MRAVGGFFALRRIPGTVRPKLVASAISTLTVLVSCVLFGPQIGLVSMMGAMTALWESGRPLWARVRNGLLVATAMTACMSAGVLVGPYRWALVPASVLIILVVSVLYYAFMLTTGPSPVMLFYSAVLGTYFGADPEVGRQVVGVTAFAAFLTAVLVLLPLIFGAHRPERSAVADAERAVAAYEELGAAESAVLREHRNQAYVAVNHAWLTLQSAWPGVRSSRHRALAQELLQLNRALASTLLRRLGLSGAIRPLTADTPLLTGRPGWRFLLSHALRQGSVAWFTSWRMALAAAVAGTVSLTVGIGHPYWAILTATVVILQWMDRVTTTRRAAHRAVGTLLGVGVVWAISSLHPSSWWTVAIVIVCLVGQNIVLPMNYAFGLALITPMSLLAVDAAQAGGSVESLMRDRFIDTLIGVATSVAVAWGTSRFFPRRLVRAQSQRTAVAAEALEKINASGDPFGARGQQARVELQYELVHQVSVLERAVRDDPRLADCADAEHRVADEGYAALGRAWQAPSWARTGAPLTSTLQDDGH
ncbi:FUSC family protein [Streptomyces sp. NPDC058321]|uniref:FUSC family protein n=1 Tax=Streptomyces sp. NPDC058321 TaxID=3346445 RepID=UPI0036F04171